LRWLILVGRIGADVPGAFLLPSALCRRALL
jgi:hypothetical protein